MFFQCILHSSNLGLESQVIMFCQNIADLQDNGAKLDAIIVDFLKAFDLVPHNRLFMNIAASVVELMVGLWIREFCLGHMQRVRGKL